MRMFCLKKGCLNRLGVMFAMLFLISGQSMAMKAPQDLVAETTDKITSVLRAEQDKIKANPNYLYEIVDEVVLPHFDFSRMSSWVLGKYWRTANDKEREQFTEEFRVLLVRTYAKALNDNYDKKIKMMPVRISSDGKDATVQTEVQQDAGFPIPIDYKMYVKGDAWKVYDVSVDGISLVANYRTSFAQEIRQDGLPKLIARLADRNKQASNE